ncbi:MAG TPA: Gfo/Idh/MocA family oxidoreductase [Burkholderiales bacterium]|nr:Gfo/Idh/MocA family oxidoreductase [Burkholderiales bacterium]
MINAAIVGLGWWGRNLLGAVQGRSEKLRFVHGVSKEVDAALPLAEAHGLTLSDDLERALADPRVEAVVLATPHSLHADQIVRVAAARKPVFCEKPLALTRADAERAVAACRSAGVALAVGQNKRFWPSMVELRRIVASGALGRVMHVEGHYSNENSGLHFSSWRDSPGESPGGGMTGTGIHLLDALVSLAGPVASASAQLAVFREGRDPRDTVCALLRFATGPSGFLGAVRASPFYWRVQVFGDEASAEALGETEVVIRLRGGRIERREFPKVDSLRAELEAFADAIEGRNPYPVTPQEMVDTIAAFEAVVRSIRTGRPARADELN